MHKISYKPISVNQAYTGKRHRTPKYNTFIRAVSLLLPNNITAPEGYFYVIYEFGFSNILSDFDGGIKNFQDVLQKKYNFDDKMIAGGYIQKVKVKKGDEYIRFKFFALDQKQEFIKEVESII